MRAFPVWLAMVLAPGLAWGGIVWRGDFETGDRSQYTGTQMVSADRLQVVTSPVAEGRYALKATVKQGDDPISSSGNRNELVYQGREKEGSEYYYRWKVMFPGDFPSVKTWQLFTQWHHYGCCGSPPVEFLVNGEEVRFTLSGATFTPWKTPLVRGVWHEFIFHVKWSSDPKVGFVELYYDGKLVLPKLFTATTYPGDSNYLKVGLYRNESVAPVGVVYHDGFIQATELSDVLTTPPVDPPVDAGTPTVDAGTPATDAGTPIDAGTPTVDAGTPQPEPDAGTPVVDAGTVVPDAGTPEPETPGTVSPPTSEEVPPPLEEAPQGCSASGGRLAAVALLGLLGAARLRRRR
ncbi:heparin lyase I family protein [Myxococcaceae bacterium GXIMD 01537]